MQIILFIDDDAFYVYETVFFVLIKSCLVQNLIFVYRKCQKVAPANEKMHFSLILTLHMTWRVSDVFFV